MCDSFDELGEEESCRICLEALSEGVVRCVKCAHGVHARCQARWTAARTSKISRCSTCWTLWGQQAHDWDTFDAEVAAGRRAIRQCLRAVLEHALEHRSLLRRRVVVVDRDDAARDFCVDSACFKAVSHLERSFNESCALSTDAVAFSRVKDRWARLLAVRGRRSLVPLFDLATALAHNTTRVLDDGGRDVSKPVLALLAHLTALDDAIKAHAALLDTFAQPLRTRQLHLARQEKDRLRDDRDHETRHRLRFGALAPLLEV